MTLARSTSAISESVYAYSYDFMNSADADNIVSEVRGRRRPQHCSETGSSVPVLKEFRENAR